MKHSISAGGVVLNRKGQVVIVSQRGNSWSLPKGHLDSGETALQAAQREILEETGLTKVELVKELITYDRYKIGKEGGEDKQDLKTITLFLFTTRQQILQPRDPANPEARWVSMDEAAKMLTHPVDREKFNELWTSGALTE